MPRKGGILWIALEVILSIFAWLLIAIVTVAVSLLVMLDYCLRKWVDPDLDRAHRLSAFWGRTLIRLAPGAFVEVVGYEHLPRKRPVIFMANHQSYSDIPILYFLRESFKWMATKELFRIPFLGWSMRMSGYIAVDRTDPRAAIKTLRDARDWLDKGISIFMFPEGTRSRVGAFGQFQKGGFKVAMQSKVPIVPVVLVGTRQLLPRNGFVFQLFAKPKICILEALDPKDFGPKETELLMRITKARMIRAYRREIHAMRKERDAK